MKILLVTNHEQTKLLQDEINIKIVKNLIQKDLSVSELAKVLGSSVVKTWRRVKILEKNGIIRQSSRQLVANLEKKLYRATAVRYRSEDSFELVPENKLVSRAYQKFKQIQSDVISLVQGADEVPSEISPFDYSIASDLFAVCTAFLKPENQARMQSVLEEITQSDMLKQKSTKKR